MCSKDEKDWFEDVAYEIEVIKTNSCRANHKVGQKFIIDDFTTPKGMCIETFHSMYPLLFAGKIKADFTKLGSKDKDERIFNCPGRVVQFLVRRYFQCNNCGKRVNEEKLKLTKKNYGTYSLDILACEECYEKLENEK